MRWAILSLALWLALPGVPMALEGLQPGMKAPQVPLDAFDGGRMSLPGVPGARATLVVFWATWSGKSPELLERAQRAFRTLRAHGLAVVGVNVERQQPGATEIAAAREMAARLGLSFPLALDRGLEAFHAYGVVAVPSSVLIGPDGTVLGALAGYPIAGREDFFDLVEAAAMGRMVKTPTGQPAPGPSPRAVRYYNLGRSMAARGFGDQADATLKRAIEADPGFILPRILLAQLYRERALSEEAIEVDGQTRLTARRSQEERARWLREAEQQLNEAVRLEPRNAAALTGLAQVHAAAGNPVQAWALVERALAADPLYPGARAQLGALLLERGELERGRSELAAAVEANPLDWRLHVEAARAFEARGLPREAATAYRHGVELLWRQRRQPAGER